MLSFALVSFAGAGFSQDPGGKRVFSVDDFSGPAGSDGLPAGWEALTFKKVPRHTRYSLEPDPGGGYLKAESEEAASGLMRRLDLNPAEYPVLSWRWKVGGIIPEGDVRTKEGDDYAARIYVTFKYEPEKAKGWERIKYGAYKALYGEYPPGASLNYIWANRLPKGESVWSPYSNRSRLIAVESGSGGVGEWITEEVNIWEDYKKHFGGDPPPVLGIALMTDTDNTHASATAYYDDIEFRRSE